MAAGEAARGDPARRRTGAEGVGSGDVMWLEVVSLGVVAEVAAELEMMTLVV